MANLSNINNKLIVTDGGNLLVNATANLATYGGITIDNFSDPSIAMKTTGTSGWLWTQYITSTGTNNFSMGVNQTTPYWCVKAGAGMDSPHLVVDSSGNVIIGGTSTTEKLDVNGRIRGDNFRLGGSDSTVFYGMYRAGTESREVRLVSYEATPNSKVQLGMSNISGSSYTFAPALTVKANLKVGVGTTDPLNILHIKDEGVILRIEDTTQGLIGFIGDADACGLGTAGDFGIRTADDFTLMVGGSTPTLKMDSAGSIAMGNFSPSGTPTADYRSFEIGRQGNTITGAPWKSNLYFSTNATITAGSTTFTYRYASVPATQLILENGEFAFGNAASGTVGSAVSFTERMRIYQDGDITMGQFTDQQAPANGILKIRTSGSTANVCYPLLYVGGSTHLATRQYGIGFDPEGYADRMKMFFGVDGMGNGYSFGDFVWNIQAVADGATVTPADEKMRLDKGGDLKLKTGNLAITNTSKGILLGGTGTANQLRIYQHGTWAPQIYYQNATDQANATNSTQVGLYTRIGNMCMVQFRLIWTQASGSPAVDNIGIKNLPFGGNTTQAYAEVPCSLIGYTGGPSPRGNLTLTLPGANLTIALFNDTNNVGNMGNAIGSGTKEMRFSFTYTTNG